MSGTLVTQDGATGTMRRRRMWALLAAAVTVVAVVGLYLFQPWQLFTTTTVDEGLPAGVAAADLAAAPAVSVSPGAPSAPPAGPVVIGAGSFRSFEHETSGTATLFTTADGQAVVRLAGFATSNGPDVKVWLSKAPADTAGDARSAGYVDLGILKGNRGNQNYVVPAGTDLSEHRSVVIWCDRFSVPFGAAPLDPA